ncbi:MAG: Lrp/AsnC family transcriptional regulator [Angustibacter sp.]
MDTLDVGLLRILSEHPRLPVVEIARRLGIARGTAQARLDRLERSGVITGYGPDIDLAAAGYPVQAFVSLQIAQGSLEEVAAELADLPAVLEAYATTGSSDVLCRLAASSHDDLQRALLELGRCASIARSTSVVVLSQIVAPRVLPLLADRPRPAPRRSRVPRVQP